MTPTPPGNTPSPDSPPDPAAPQPYVDRLGMGFKLKRLAWLLAYCLLFRYTPRGVCHGWRAMLLRAFGAKVGRGCKISPSCMIWAPWNLELSDYVALGDGVDCYCVGKIKLGTKVAISQRAYLCAATHRIDTLQRELVVAPITIGEHVWVCAEAFVGPGVTLGDGVVVGARAAVFSDVEPWSVVGGVPARFIKPRLVEGVNSTSETSTPEEQA